MGNLALIDLIRPYFFVGVDLGEEFNQILEFLHVDEYEEAWDDDGVVICGVARVADESTGVLAFSLNSNAPGASDLEFDPQDTAIDFRLSVARRPAESLSADDLTDSGLQTAVRALGPADSAPSDYPNTQFRLELLFNLITLTFPGLVGAEPDGAFLKPDPNNREVKFDLPRIVLQVDQDSASDTDAEVEVASWGAETLNEPDEEVASLFKMRPALALFHNDQFGIGLEKAVLDLSDEHTPPDLLDRFGLGDDFTGIHLPEFRFYFSQAKSVGYAGNVGARDLIIGFKPEPAIWGDISFDLDFRGDDLAASLRLISAGGSSAEIEPSGGRTGDPAELRRYRANISSNMRPETENYLLMVDVNSGAAPYTITAAHALDHGAVDGHTADTDTLDAFIAGTTDVRDLSALQRMRLFPHDQQVVVSISDREDRKLYLVLDLYAVRELSGRSVETDPNGAPAVRLEPPTDRVRIVDQSDPNQVTVRLDPPDGAIAGTIVTDGRATVPIAPGETRPLNVEWTVPPTPEPATLKAYFRFAEPGDRETTDTATLSGTAFTSGNGTALDFGAFRRGWEAELASGTRPRIEMNAYASREGTANPDYNLALSARRAEAFKAALMEEISSLRDSDFRVMPWGEAPAEEVMSSDPNYRRENFRYVVATFVRTAPRTDPYSGELIRDPAEPDEDEDDDPIAPPESQRPDWLRSIGATIRWERDPVPTAAELRGTIDFQTAHEDALEQYRDDLGTIGPGLEEPEESNLPALGSEPNPDDGVVEFRITVTHDPATATFTETLVARAGAGDRDGLWSWGEIPASEDATPSDDAWRDLLGLYFALAPLTSSTAADAANGGDVVPLVVSLATPIVVTALGIAHVDRLTHYGIELGVTHDEDEVNSVLLFDVESAIRLNLAIGDLEIVTTRVDKPIKVRYKAIGFGLDVAPDGTPDFRPVFDSSRGYTLDLADSGSLRVLPALGDAIGDIIQVLGARIARTNPLNIEVDLGLGVDLGVFKVDKFGFRLPVDPLGVPAITAIGIGVDIPDTLVGKGYLQILDDSFAGQLDLALPTVGLRVAAGVKIETVEEGDRSATGVLATLEVEFPGGIPLGGTGMAIFGFLGLFAMHHARDENTSARNPALDWLDSKVHGNPTDITGWKGQLDSWAFGLGVVAGTIEGGTILNIKGMLVLELPGPRILLFVKAQLLSEKPATKGTTTGNLLAVVDINPNGVMIGIQIEYEIKEILHLQIPIEAGFPFEDPENFYVDIGTIGEPIKATVLEVFDATAYLMVHGNGIPQFPLIRDGLQGFSLATGFEVSITWGDKDIGLYLEVAAGFDAGIGFAPLTFAGRIYLRGALHLIIVAIEASAALTVKAAEVETGHGDPPSTELVTYIHGEVCGKISLLFFTIEACVEFSLGNDPDEPPPPRPIRDLTLQSRSPALAEGSAVDRGVDTVLCRGTRDGTVPVVDGSDGPREVRVPIDAIPLLQFEAGPVVDGSAIDGTVQGAPPPGDDGWQKRGTVYVRYHVSRVELELVAQHGVPVAAGTEPTTDGPRPYTWRIGSDDGSGDGLPVDLAMLDWKPTNTDKAILEGETLDRIVEDGWGEACTPVARPASVLWTFRDSPLGPNDAGWSPHGEAWPDEPGSRRTRPVDAEVVVREIWRTGTPLDGLLPHKPAEIVGSRVQCPSKELQERAHRKGEKMCASKVLEAPYELLGTSLQPEVFDSPLGEALAVADEARAKGLRDVVRISGGPHEVLTLLVVADEKLVGAGLMGAAAYDAANRDLGPVDIAFERVGAESDLPERWRDTRGPWWDEVRLARGHESGTGRRAEFLVHVKPPRAAFHIDLGLRPLRDAVENFGLLAPSWFLVAFEGLSERESRRHEAEDRQAEANEEALADSLDSDPHALLLPDAEYRVVVHYTAETGRKTSDGEEGDPNQIDVKWTIADETDPRTFFTDDKAPRNLEPWMLAQFPAPDEPHHFHDEPVVFVFATDDVLELYAAYDRSLRAAARAASFRGSDGTPEAPFTRVMLDGLFERMEALVLSPFEATARRLLADKPCRDFDPGGDRHGRAAVDFHLDPVTDYVIDIEALDDGGDVAAPEPREGEIGERPLYRQRMTTSRYGSRDEFARAVRESRVVHRRVEGLSALTALDGAVGDDEFDRALTEVGLEARPRPASPQITVLWNADAEAVPVAIYIEAPEPLWRSRLEPEPVYADDGVHILQWRLNRSEWLVVDELIESGGGSLAESGYVRPGRATPEVTAPTIAQLRERFLRHLPEELRPEPPATAKVERFARDTSGARTLAFLKPGSRGSTVALGLARELHPLLDLDTADTAALLGEFPLDRPAWEMP
ncbi:hypothetical protein L0U85_08065 [Glycomyces sp. L485]|uniref:hypothetical protein n=1 Tax=Glycomyces sp. L485 TaxID=2909235 RepID=UPI001F4AB1CB|nr:hypothetical protein [Glycomyces sp. L485]MCH7230803.1 hypothetical protein [Glycomyces sp. L485]